MFFFNKKKILKKTKNLTLTLSWKLEAWYWAYFAIVVWDLWEIHGQTFFACEQSQFSSDDWFTCVLTSMLWSGFASTNVFVENKPKSINLKEKNLEENQFKKK